MVNRPTTNDAATEERSAAASTADRALWPSRVAAIARHETSPRFYVCVGVLLFAAVSMQSVARALGGYFRKVAVPLKRPLDALDQGKLLPQYRPHRIQPEPLSPEAIENLGTEEYLLWNLRDTDQGRRDPTAVAHLFITYYTGQPDMVPHNPKECLHAAGLIQRKETLIEVSVPRPDGEHVDIPVSVLEFDEPRRRGRLSAGGSSDGRRVVAYFFYANGDYVLSRTGVRTRVANLWDRHAYYSKIELSFSSDSFRTLADREETVEACRRLLRKIMPVLWADHYQDWEALKRGRPPVVLDRQGQTEGRQPWPNDD